MTITTTTKSLMDQLHNNYDKSFDDKSYSLEKRDLFFNGMLEKFSFRLKFIFKKKIQKT